MLFMKQAFQQPIMLSLTPLTKTLKCEQALVSLWDFLARDVKYTSRAYAMMPVRLSVCL